jgi:hypothetical protein
VRSWDIAATVASIVVESIVGIDTDATCQRTSRSPVSAGASTRAPVRVVPFLTRMAVGTRAHLVRSSSMSEQAELYKEKAAECSGRRCSSVRNILERCTLSWRGNGWS